MRSGAGLLVCGVSCILDDIEAGDLLLVFAGREHLIAAHPYRVKTRPEARARAQVTRFLDWLKAEAAMTKVRMDTLVSD